jgi:GNAT superfamily N-acetyltransferase
VTDAPTLPETIAPEPLDGVDARALVAALDAESMARYPNPEDNFLELSPAEVAPGAGVFLIARWGGRPVGCGAVRLDEGDAAEIKRMYVVPDGRGRGLAGRILRALEDHARSLGARRLVLETGARQPEAIAVYTRAGFVPIPRFGKYTDAPASLCFGKSLHDPPMR